jgi:hypothetical protein
MATFRRAGKSVDFYVFIILLLTTGVNMSDDFAEIKSIHDFPSLVRYLRKEPGCP